MLDPRPKHSRNERPCPERPKSGCRGRLSARVVTAGAHPMLHGGEPLTPSERRVLELLATGQRNAEIADVLVVSVKTVEFHVSNVLSKLGVRSRAEAVVKAYRHGLLSVEAPWGSGC